MSIGRTTEMWKRVVIAAQIEDKSVLVCVHQMSMVSHLANIPLDEEGHVIGDYVGRISRNKWKFPDGGEIVVHVPGQRLDGECYNSVALDHHARNFFTIGEWWDEILT